MDSLFNSCKHLVTVCADLKAHETALIITDEKTRELGAELYVSALTVSSNLIHQTIPSVDIHGREPPSDIAALMKEVDVIFGLTSMSMAHTDARYQATLCGARYLSLPDYSKELLLRPALLTDFKQLTPLAELIAKKFTDGNTIYVETPLGTQLSLTIKGRIGNAAPGWCFAKGTLASPPDAEVNVPPVETETEGTLVVDGSIPCQELGLLKNPITLTLKKGKIIHIQGKEAHLLEALFNKQKNNNVRIAAEFGIGLNPKAELIGSMLEDEGCLGTIHIGFGSNSTIGGKNKVPFHLDTIIKNATVFIDKEMIMDSGILMLKEKKSIAV